MIRNVVVGRLRAPADEQQATADSKQLDRALAAIVALPGPGRVGRATGRDLRLRDGGWDYAITSDWVDEAAYRAYAADEEHNRIRRELFAPICEQIARVQFTVDP